MNRPQLTIAHVVRTGEWASDPRRHCAPGKVADPEIFFSDSHSGYANMAALSVCQWCPVQQPCREYALSHPGLHGVWGGLTQRDRDRIHRQMAAAAKEDDAA